MYGQPKMDRQIGEGYGCAQCFTWCKITTAVKLQELLCGLGVLGLITSFATIVAIGYCVLAPNGSSFYIEWTADAVGFTTGCISGVVLMMSFVYKCCSMGGIRKMQQDNEHMLKTNKVNLALLEEISEWHDNDKRQRRPKHRELNRFIYGLGEDEDDIRYKIKTDITDAYKACIGFDKLSTKEKIKTYNKIKDPMNSAKYVKNIREIVCDHFSKKINARFELN